MLTVPFLYYFAVRYLLREEGADRKDYWMLEVLGVLGIVLVWLLAVIPDADKAIFQKILNGTAAIGDTVPTGTSVMLALDNAIFLFFMTESIFIQIFFFVSIFKYKKSLEAYYSSNDGKFLNLIGLLMLLVTVRIVFYFIGAFIPDAASSIPFHIVQTVLFSAYFIAIAVFTCKINYTAEELGRLISKEEDRGRISSSMDLIGSRMEKLIADKFYLDPNTDLIGLSSQVHVNCKYLAEYFKSTFSETFMLYVNKKRIEHSKALLVESTLPLEDVAQQSGYLSFSTFLRNFVKIEGQTPAKYRKNNEKNVK